MAFQLSYGEQAAAFAGMKSDLSRDENVASYAQGEASAEIPFGVFVRKSTAGGVTGSPDKAILFNDTAGKVAGLVLHSHSYAPTYELGTTGLKPKVMMSVMTRGRAWAICEEALAEDAIPFIRFAAGTGTQLGALLNTADTASAVKMRGLKVLKASTGAGIVLVEFDTAIMTAMLGVTGY